MKPLVKKRTALRVMKRLGLVHHTLSLKNFSRLKNLLHPKLTWSEYCQWILFSNWYLGNAPEKEVYIPELNTYIGCEAWTGVVCAVINGPCLRDVDEEAGE